MNKVSNLVTAVMSSLVFALLPMASYAIGLGNVVLHSHLNEPLDADIAITDLKGVAPDDVIVIVADQQAYEAAGLQPIGWLTSIRFQVVKDEIAGNPTLKLKTKEAVKDPFVDLLIEVKWPNGTLLREYTLLLDPPKSIIPVTRSIKKKHLEKAEASGTSPQLSAIPGGTYGPIRDESLWSIAKSLAINTHTNVYQATMAIAEKNPHAFRGGNINNMLTGAVLKLPDKAELEQYSLEQSQDYIAMQGQTPSHDTFPVKRPLKPQQALKLVTPVQALESAKVVTQSLPVKSETPIVFAERLNLIEEAIDTLKRSNEEMTKKNKSLQDHNQSLEKLLSMKEDEIKKLVDLVKQPNVVSVADNPAQEQFAVAISDVRAKPSENDLTPPDLANMAPAKPFIAQTLQPTEHSKPIEVNPSAIKVGRTEPNLQIASVAISADEQTVKRVAVAPQEVIEPQQGHHFTLWLWVVGLAAICTFAWLRRHRLITVLQLKLQTMLTKQLVTEAPPEAVDNYGLEFDLEKTLDAIEKQEKKFKNPLQLTANNELNTHEKQFEAMYEDVEECISYERFGQAEKILKEILTRKVDEWQAALKLLEVYVLTEKYAEFETLYLSLPKDLREIAPGVWSKIELLHQKVSNEKAVTFESSMKFTDDPISIQSKVTENKNTSAKDEFIDLEKTYQLSLVDNASTTMNESRDVNSDAITIESLPTMEAPDAVTKNSGYDIQKAQIALAKAYIDMGEYAEAKVILTQLKKEAVGEQAAVVDSLLETLL